ncbi:MAG: hypothetical protein ACOC3V_03315 [bacterium]
MKANSINVKFSHDKENRRSHCIIETADGDVYKGISYVHPNDHYCKDRGRKESMKKALKKTEFSKAQRAEIWEAYRRMTKEPRW